jgi:hypothetical protein
MTGDKESTEGESRYVYMYTDINIYRPITTKNTHISCINHLKYEYIHMYRYV